MLVIFANRTFLHLFAAQVIALIGTGIATVALGLLAWDMAGENAGVILGTALAIKMVAYVGLAPVISAFADRMSRRALLVTLDLLRATFAMGLPFVNEVWQIYLLIFLLQAGSAGFTPAFHATIADIFPDEAEYTRALSLSRLAYDLEMLLSPMLAAALLTIVSFPVLFSCAVIGFVASAFLILTVNLPSPKPGVSRGFGDRVTRGIRIYIATPRLRCLFALSLALSAAGAMVIVNTVVLVKARLGLNDTEVAFALSAFGGGSMMAALILPKLLDKVSDLPVMLSGGIIIVIAMFLGPLIGSLSTLIALWFVLGFGYSLTQTPSGRFLLRSAQPEDRSRIFAAQFVMSHVCWLITYSLVGRLGAGLGLDSTFIVMGVLACICVGSVLPFRSSAEPKSIKHRHPELPDNHPHLIEHGRESHQHPIVIDDLHWRWPK